MSGAGRYAHDGDTGGDIACDNGARSDDRAISDGLSREHDCSGSDQDESANVYPATQDREGGDMAEIADQAIVVNHGSVVEDDTFADAGGGSYDGAGGDKGPRPDLCQG